MAMSSGRKLFIGIVALLVGAVVLVGFAYWWVNQQVAGVPGDGEPVTYEIESGATAASIGDDLAELEVIRNSLAFRLIARSRGLDSRIASGTYELETGMSVDAVIAALDQGPGEPDVIRVTIPEGLTVEQTLPRLAEASPYDVADFRAVLDEARANPTDGPLSVPDWVPDFNTFSPEHEVFEGLLYPQTYEFDDEAEVATILQRLIDQTEVAVATVSPSALEEAEAQGFTLYQGLIAASLVEREARVPGEWREIASVIRNRLDEGMRLQIDATLLYAAGTPDAGPAAVDRDVESPYNTYANEGLPPTPIAGARPEAIQAVFDPAETPYLYYVVAPECDGSHRFATTNEEHNQNVAAYREANRCQ